jgi:hypothetical protein
LVAGYTRTRTAFAATSAPTQPQVRGVLWREINDAHRKGNLIGRVNQTEWLVGNELIGFARKLADPAEGGTDETSPAFHGQHAPFMLVVLDEAGGIPGPLWAAAKSLITGPNNRILAMGIPEHPTSEFEDLRSWIGLERDDDLDPRHSELHRRRSARRAQGGARSGLA